MILPEDAGRILLPLARAAIATRLGKFADPPDMTGLDWLLELRASFVTLTEDGMLRGCIGSLQASRPLREDVIANARHAAFDDPRFTPVRPGELERLRTEVSVLSTPEPLDISGEQDAWAQLRPGIDGVILREGNRRATFLPQVWEQLPRPQDFLASLKRKAGLPADYWSDRLMLDRYTVTAWSEESDD
jgi:AmmeMemoRadiSam system protein A